MRIGREAQDRLPSPARAPAGYRDYDPGILDRLAFIRQTQSAGLTLGQIRQVLAVSDGGQPPCQHVAGLIARRLAEVRARLAELTRTRDQLRGARQPRRGAGSGRLLSLHQPRPSSRRRALAIAASKPASPTST